MLKSSITILRDQAAYNGLYSTKLLRKNAPRLLHDCDKYRRTAVLNYADSFFILPTLSTRSVGVLRRCGGADWPLLIGFNQRV